MILVGIDSALRDLENTGRRSRQRRWRHRIGWRQVAVQVLFVLAAVVFVTALLRHGQANP
ncbi:hypothetical protein ACFT8W_35140 [Streptomyces hygroscopicus]|uniref:hypothetical protein n=1 Tax=Streptomyces hygroscopicus TaxID=1912 RepID=UPI003629EDD2